MREQASTVALAAKGFLSHAEGLALYRLAAENAPRAPCLEIGSYCGRSTIFLAEGCRAGRGYRLWAVDHHRGSPEQQPGQPYYDPALYDEERGVVTTLPAFLNNLHRAELMEWITPVLDESQAFARRWTGPLSLVFIDGSHVPEDVFVDYFLWSTHVMPGGALCIHDVYSDESQGGQAPRQMMEFALSTGYWQFVEQIDTLAILRRSPGVTWGDADHSQFTIHN